MNDQAHAAFLSEFNKIQEVSIANANRGVTHAEFVTGVQRRTMGFRCVIGEPSHLIRGFRRKIFGALVLLYLVVPTVFISLWALHRRDWWLLFGIAGSAIGIRIAARLQFDPRKQNSVGSYLLIAFVASWIFAGLHSYYVFFSLSVSWGFILFAIADCSESAYALQSLVENSDHFDQAIALQRIMIIRKAEKEPNQTPEPTAPSGRGSS